MGVPFSGALPGPFLQHPSLPRPGSLTHSTVMPRQHPLLMGNFLGPGLFQGNTYLAANVFRRTSKDGNNMFFPKSLALLS